MIRYLGWEEKQSSRSLWEEVFPEETAGYNDFYYRVKMRRNRLLAYIHEEKIAAMLHRNPYRVKVKDRVWDLDYIVGVATAKAMRRQGLMRRLLCRALDDMYTEKKPFCYLMPADEKIYVPFDFVRIYDRGGWELRSGPALKYVCVKPEDADLLARAEEFVDRWLEMNYQVYCVRDQRYWAEFLDELYSEAGIMSLVYDAPEDGREQKLVGVKCDWGLEERELRALYALDGYTAAAKPALPGIMARIVHLEEFIQVICLRGGCGLPEMSVRLDVTDSLLSGNEGRYIWHIDHRKSTVRKVWGDSAADDDRESLCLSVRELTSWLFGYQKKTGLPAWCDRIETLQRPYFDELV